MYRDCGACRCAGSFFANKVCICRRQAYGSSRSFTVKPQRNSPARCKDAASVGTVLVIRPLAVIVVRTVVLVITRTPRLPTGRRRLRNGLVVVVGGVIPYIVAFARRIEIASTRCVSVSVLRRVAVGLTRCLLNVPVAARCLPLVPPLTPSPPPPTLG